MLLLLQHSPIRVITNVYQQHCFISTPTSFLSASQNASALVQNVSVAMLMFLHSVLGVLWLCSLMHSHFYPKWNKDNLSFLLISNQIIIKSFLLNMMLINGPEKSKWSSIKNLGTPIKFSTSRKTFNGVEVKSSPFSKRMCSLKRKKN